MPPTPGYPQEQPQIQAGIPTPSIPSSPHEQPGAQADRIPIPSIAVTPGTHDSYGSGAPGEAAPAYAQAGARQKASRWESQTWAQAGIKDIKRQSSTGLIILIIVLIFGLISFVAYNFGHIQGPVDAIKGMISKIELPSSIPFLSSLSANRDGKDTTPPVISNIVVANVTDKSASVKWVTDEPATSQVMLCEANGVCCWTELDKKLVTNHSVTVSNLNPNTKYHYTASSLDANENEATSEGELATSDGTAPATPASPAPTSPLLISGITSTIAEKSATLKWETSVATTGQVEYGKTEAYGSTELSAQGPTTKHSVTLSSLEPTTTYYFRLRVRDTSGNEAISEGRTFITGSLPPGVSEGVKMGMRAPNFTLQTIDGKTVNLTDYRNKLVMVNFWAGGYQRCKTEIPVIQEIYNNWLSKELVVLGINSRETPTEVQKFVNEKKITYKVLLDPAEKVAKQYDVTSIPTTFFIDKNGIIKEVRNSALNAGAIEAILESM